MRESYTLAEFVIRLVLALAIVAGGAHYQGVGVSQPDELAMACIVIMGGGHIVLMFGVLFYLWKRSSETLLRKFLRDA